MQWELAKNREEWGLAAEAVKAEIACRDAVLHFPSRDSSFCREYLGDALLEASKASRAAAAAKLLSEARDAYRGAVRGLVVTLGPSHPWSGVAAKKLATALARMQGAEVGLPVGACSFCAGSRLDGQALARCGRCKQASYCCTEHQKAHWPLHKKCCAAGPAS